MTTETADPIELFARLNPISPEALDELARGPEGQATFTRVVARREGPPLRARPTKRLVLAAVLALALAIPALAFSGILDGLFGFSNPGTPVGQEGPTTLHALEVTGATDGSLVQLATRDGLTVYGARRRDHSLCFYWDLAGKTDPGLDGGCLRPLDAADFPSEARPVWDMSTVYFSSRDLSLAGVQYLVGVAADGVRSVQVLARSDCRAIVTVPVIDNVYVDTHMPVAQESWIVARDASGKAVWHESAAKGEKMPSCGLEGGR
ncbi:MAG TPA: hypothetical protein VJ716_00850 [Gaiellaceae bacterium]|nr:hypothetical protein [Gaiellaceae bacterium]